MTRPYRISPGVRLHDLQQLLASSQPCPPEHGQEFRQAYTAFATTRSVPRYFMSPSYLAHEKSYVYTVHLGCLVVLKRKWLRNPVLYAALPPISYQGNLQEEIECMRHLLALGIGVKLSAEDMALYASLPGLAIADKGNEEYVYDVARQLALAGNSYRRLRYAVNTARRAMATGDVHAFHLPGPLWPAHAAEANDVKRLARAWQQERSRYRGQLAQADAAIAGMAHVSLLYAGSLSAYQLSEQVAPTWVIGAAHAWRPTTLYNQPSLYVQWHDTAAWAGLLAASEAQPVYYNYGSAVGDSGLTEHKEALQPCMKLQIYTLRPTEPVTAEEWRQATPGSTTQPQPQLAML